MHQAQLKHACKVVAFIATFFAVIVWLLQPASGGTITGGFSSFSDETVDLSTAGDLQVRDWAVWGTSPSATPLTAQFTQGTGVIDYSLINVTNGNPLRTLGNYSSPPLYLPSNVYGGLQHNGQGQPNSNVGEGFTLRVHADGSPMTVNVWGNSYAGSTLLTITGSGFDPIAQSYGLSAFLSQPFLSSYSLTDITGDVFFTYVLTSDESGIYHSANLGIGAAQVASPIASVPEISHQSVGCVLVMTVGVMFLLERSPTNKKLS